MECGGGLSLLPLAEPTVATRCRIPGWTRMMMSSFWERERRAEVGCRGSSAAQNLRAIAEVRQETQMPGELGALARVITRPSPICGCPDRPAGRRGPAGGRSSSHAPMEYVQFQWR